jgi:hypothetical protein
MLFEAAKILITAILSAGLGGFWVSRWKASLDHSEKRIDDLCAEIAKLADFGSEYWLLPQTDDKVPVLQARLTSGMLRIATIRVSLAGLVKGLGNDRIVQAEMVFIRETTGGDFGVHNRAVSAAYAASAQHSASALIVEIRRARMQALQGQWYLPRV